MAHTETRFARETTVLDRTYEKGAPVPPGTFTPRRRRQLLETRRLEEVIVDDGVDLAELDHLKAENDALKDLLGLVEAADEEEPERSGDEDDNSSESEESDESDEDEDAPALPENLG